MNIIIINLYNIKGIAENVVSFLYREVIGILVIVILLFIFVFIADFWIILKGGDDK